MNFTETIASKITNKKIIILFSSILLIVSTDLSIPLPTGIPFTFQVLTLALIAVECGSTIALWSMNILLLSRMHHFFGLSGGFLWGMFLASFIWGQYHKTAPILRPVLLMLGMMPIYTLGMMQYSYFFSDLNFYTVFTHCIAPFLVFDGLKLLAVYLYKEFS